MKIIRSDKSKTPGFLKTMVISAWVGGQGADIIDQQQLANHSYLRYLFHRIAGNTGKNLALRKIFMELKSRGYSVSQGTIYQMADLAESVYLYKRISRFDHSLIKRENADKKCYFIDNGMLHAIDGSFSTNKGMLLENMVFWQLYRMYGNIYTTDIYYYQDPYHECDFVLYKEGGQAGQDKQKKGCSCTSPRLSKPPRW